MALHGGDAHDGSPCGMTHCHLRNAIDVSFWSLGAELVINMAVVQTIVLTTVHLLTT